MHSGRDAGLGGMGFTPASQGGTHIVERNLTRLTVAVGILFTANCVRCFTRWSSCALAPVALVAAGCGSSGNVRLGVRLPRRAARCRSRRADGLQLAARSRARARPRRDDAGACALRDSASDRSRTGAVVPGSARAWRRLPTFGAGRSRAGSAPSIAAALRRVQRLRDAPANWLFDGRERISADATTLNIRLRSSWRRFPYALTAVGAAPRFVPGPFELVSGTKRLVVARREGLTLQFRRLGARAAVQTVQSGAAGRGAGAARRHRRDEGRRAARERRPSAHAARPRSRRVRRRPITGCGPPTETPRTAATTSSWSRSSAARARTASSAARRRTRRGFAGRSARSRRCRAARSGSSSRPYRRCVPARGFSMRSGVT